MLHIFLHHILQSLLQSELNDVRALCEQKDGKLFIDQHLKLACHVAPEKAENESVHPGVMIRNGANKYS